MRHAVKGGMRQRRPPRLKSFSYRGKYRYFVTFCAFERRQAFTSPDRVGCVRSEILRTCIERGFAVIAQVFMPDHLHMLLEGRTDESHFPSCMTLARQRSAHAFRAAFHERLWQEGYFDVVIRDADHARLVITYIVNNPVRDGLCTSPNEFPYLYLSVRI